MTTTPAMPELPEVPLIRFSTGHGVEWAKMYTADQMRAYAIATLQAQPAEVSDDEREAFEAWATSCWHDISKYEGLYKSVQTHALWCAWETRAILALRPQSESEQEKELRRSLAEAQATISERNAEIIELQKRIHRSPQAVPMTDERLAEVLTTAYGSPEWTMDDVRAARAVEAAALGITAPAGGEGW